MSDRPLYSIIAPFHNEAENLPQLIKEIDSMLVALGASAEIILVNDDSTDSYQRPTHTPHYPIHWLDMAPRAGQSAGIYFGCQVARGEWVVTMDADLQNDPADVPLLVRTALESKLDLVSGIRMNRHDRAIRRWSGHVANAVRRLVLCDKTTDVGCGLRLMRTDVARRLPGWNGMHRFIPALAMAMGYCCGEIPVNHRPRMGGISKVRGFKRAIQATVDLLGMLWLSRRQFKSRLQ